MVKVKCHMYPSDVRANMRRTETLASVKLKLWILLQALDLSSTCKRLCIKKNSDIASVIAMSGYGLGRCILTLVPSAGRGLGRMSRVFRSRQQSLRFSNFCSIFSIGYYCDDPMYTQLDHRNGIWRLENSSYFHSGLNLRTFRHLPCHSHIRKIHVLNVA